MKAIEITAIWFAMLLLVGCSHELTDVDAGSGGLHLCISLDRKAFLDYEPIFLEWTFRNTTKSIVKIANATADVYFTFCLVDSGGERHLCSPPECPTLGPLQITILAQGESTKARIDLRDYLASHPLGSLTLFAVYKPPELRGTQDFLSSKLTSNTIELEIRPARGQDGKAAKLVAEAIAKRGEGGYVGIFYLDRELSNRIIEDTSSSRFGAAANFYLGLRQFEEAKHLTLTKGQYMDKASAYFRACIATKGNHYLRGLSYSYLLHCKAEGATSISKDEASRIAAILTEEYADSWALMNAKSIIDKQKGDVPASDAP
ncbi:MAG: hypothetical protein AB1696_14885 [Planctomycetota bacterium]